MDPILERLSQIGIVPVIKIDEVAKAAPLAAALKAGGVPCAEVTFRTAHAAAAIEQIAKTEPEVFLGAGTVLSTEQVDRAVDAGAKFIVSPGFNPKVVEHCIQKGITVLPGCMTPTEIEMALGYGLEILKFFPAEQAGGLKFIKAVCAAYTMVRFIPTGGVTLQNLSEYIASPKVVACGGSYMCPGDLIAKGDWGQIEALCRQSVEIVNKARG